MTIYYLTVKPNKPIVGLPSSREIFFARTYKFFYIRGVDHHMVVRNFDTQNHFLFACVYRRIFFARGSKKFFLKI
jgi:hypothetical protein